MAFQEGRLPFRHLFSRFTTRCLSQTDMWRLRMITFDLEVVFMESIFIATEGDVKRWIREALEGYFSEQTLSVSRREVLGAESLLNRQQVARILDNFHGHASCMDETGPSQP